METELQVHLSSLRLVNEKLDKVLLVKSDIFQLALWVSRQLVPSEILALRTEILRYGLFFHAESQDAKPMKNRGKAIKKHFSTLETERAH